jgi:ATP-dependent DNA helicase RecQ
MPPVSASHYAATREALRRWFGYPDFRGDQADIVAHVAAGNSAFVLMPTGGGKSLCYQVPALVRDGLTVVVSPLIALMQDQVGALRRRGIAAALLSSVQTAAERQATERAVRAGTLRLLYVAPERLLTARCLRLLAAAGPALFAIDEAHCIAEWGHDFRPHYLGLRVLAERFPAVPRLALTATADAVTQEEIVTRLALQDARRFRASFDRPNIRTVMVRRRDAVAQLARFIRRRHAGAVGVVYCRSRARVEEVAAALDARGLPAIPYHAGLPAAQRARCQRWFLERDGVIIVATIAFGMGIDKADVRFVAHVDLPVSVEGYYQEIGRAGRDGLPSEAWLAYDPQDWLALRARLRAATGDAQRRRVRLAKLDAMRALCETRTCRRQALLAYFGETVGPCGHCDRCRPGLLDTWRRPRAADPAASPVRQRRTRPPMPSDPVVLARLQALWRWRAQEAARRELPLPVVFHDAALLAIAVRAPRTRLGLRFVRGVGPRRAVLYGRGVLAALRAADATAAAEAAVATP